MRPPSKIAALAMGVATLAFVSGCGEGSGEDGTATKPIVSVHAPERSADHAREGSPAADEDVAPSHCPSGLPSCRTTEGRIVYVEKVDPDGDGDAHFVVLDSQSISLPGLTAIDVSSDLRPDPLPGVGDVISAAGPVQTGSHGQDQIHALELHVAGG
jgi:hypothetical protein